MGCKFTELLCKEVVCLCDGCRLGLVSDVRLELPEGKVAALVVPGRCRWGGLGSPREDYIIPWSSVCRIGPDIILVDIHPEKCRVPRGKTFLPL